MKNKIITVTGDVLYSSYCICWDSRISR